VLIGVSEIGIILGRAGGQLIRRLTARTTLSPGLAGLILGGLMLFLLVVTFLLHVGLSTRPTAEKTYPGIDVFRKNAVDRPAAGKRQIRPGPKPTSDAGGTKCER
jgi:hypothetical protein